MKHVVCGSCPAINRLPDEKDATAAKCGKCGKPVFDGRPVELASSSFDRHISHSDIPVVVDFWAEWCGPCKMMAPAYAKAAEVMEPEVRLAKLDTEAAPDIAARFNIRSIPTMIVFKNGKEVARQAGAMPAPQITDWIRQQTR
jgi:thioredoxin 2